MAANSVYVWAWCGLILLALCCPLCTAPDPGPMLQEQAVLDILRAHSHAREQTSAAAALEQTQRAALADMPRARFVYVRMNPAAGLGNRLVAMVSGLLLAAATERGFLVDWEDYAEPLTHRSKEVAL